MQDWDGHVGTVLFQLQVCSYPRSKFLLHVARGLAFSNPIRKAKTEVETFVFAKEDGNRNVKAPRASYLADPDVAGSDAQLTPHYGLYIGLLSLDRVEKLLPELWVS